MTTKVVMKKCPFHGCKDPVLIQKDGYAFVTTLKCGSRGPTHALKSLGQELAIEMAIVEWNERGSV